MSGLLEFMENFPETGLKTLLVVLRLLRKTRGGRFVIDLKPRELNRFPTAVHGSKDLRARCQRS